MVTMQYTPIILYFDSSKDIAVNAEMPAEDVRARVERMLGARVAEWRRVSRGYSPAGRWLVRCEDRSSAFVKVAANMWTARALRVERHVYGEIAGDFLPHVLGWDDGDPPILALEDLSTAHWPPPWSDERVARVRKTLARVAATPPPSDLPTLDAMRYEFASWGHVADAPEPFLSLGLCSRGWLEAALPTLIQADQSAPLAGNCLVHLDVRSDNLCFVGGRCVLVDWNWACRGNPQMDVAGWLPSLRLEGGPPPETILPDAPELAALLAGFWAFQAGMPVPWEGSLLRQLQLGQLKVALPWAARGLGLPELDGLAMD